MYILHIISFLMIALSAGYLLKARLSDMLPFVWCGLVLVLYVLSFGRLLNLIDWIFPACALGLFCAVVRRAKEYSRYCVNEILSVSFATYLILALIIVIGVSSKIVTWWDDVNYWASDLKSLYFMNGFASKYANVSPEFGDYPPGVQLAKWFAVHMNKEEFSEGLAFTGYYLFNFSFVLPLFSRIDKKKIWIAPILAVATWLLPGIADKYGYAGFCADLSMAFIFGGILIAAVDRHEKSVLFDILRLQLYLGVLVIAKSTGAVWALFGIIFVVGCRLAEHDRFRIKYLIKQLWVVASPLLVGGSWMAFCLYRHRVTKTTSTMVTYITTDKYGLSEYTPQFIRAFIKAFLSEPLHVDRTWIDIPPVLMLVVIIAVFGILVRKAYMMPGLGRFAGIGIPIMGVLYYCIIFLAHITIFATETQYLETTAMIASIERYGVPFMLGSIMLIAWLWMSAPGALRVKEHIRLAVFILVIVAFTNIPAAYNGLVGYRATLEKDMSDRDSMITDESRLFVDSLCEAFPNGNVRVCRLHDGGYYRVADTYVAYEASPVSVMNISYDMSAIDGGTLIYAINQTHATYFYADPQETVPEYMHEFASDGEFICGQLYHVSYEDGSMVLYTVE